MLMVLSAVALTNASGALAPAGRLIPSRLPLAAPIVAASGVFSWLFKSELRRISLKDLRLPRELCALDSAYFDGAQRRAFRSAASPSEVLRCMRLG